MTTTLSTTTYTTVEKVARFVHLYTEVPTTVSSGVVIGSEAVATGDGSTTIFAFDYRKVIPSTERVYVAGVLKTVTTDYTLGADDGTITFGTAPVNSAAITAAYMYSDVEPSLVSQYIVRVEDEIDRRIGRSFTSGNSALDFYDGTDTSYTNVFAYSPTSYLDEMDSYKGNWEGYVKDRYVFTTNYPIVNVSLLAINKLSDVAYSNSYQDANQAFGGANWVAQGFKPGGSKPLVSASLYLKYNTGTSADITVGLYADSGGVPTGSALATGTITAPSATAYQYYDVYFSAPYNVTAGTQYHLVLSSASAGSSAYHWGVDSTSPSYSEGTLGTSSNSGSTWTADATKDAVFTVYLADYVIDSSDYEVYKDQGRINLTMNSGLTMTLGIRNILVAYTYGYSSVPAIVEELCTKLTSVALIESRLMGDPASSLSITAQNIGAIKEDIERIWHSLGTKWEARTI